MPQWQSSTRRDHLPDDWPRIRREVFREKGRQCLLCGAPATDIDHIVPGDDHSIENLRPLCSPCHSRKSSSEGGAAKAAKRRQIEKRFQRTEDHPGLL